MAYDLSMAQILAEPHTVEDLQVPQNLLIDIVLRLLYNEGNVDFKRIAQVTRVPNVLNGILEWLRQEHLVEISKGSGGVGYLNYVYKLTESGEDRARGALERSHYVGPFPVPVHYYSRAIELQTSGERSVEAHKVREILEDLVLPEGFHRHIGPAVNSGASLFLYGPSGNGKTTIAHKMATLISGAQSIWLPYALTAGGQIIQIHDRLFHVGIEPAQDPLKSEMDGRWGLFKRPSVVVGGELKMDALELRFDPVAKFYEAPLQLKANGGMFLIDDFGRQQISPIDLLNRWIVPLESGVDYLRLSTGQTVIVPFRELIIFSTNLDPYTLADDAFYRRIQMKVGVFSPNEQRYRQIYLRVCQQMGIPFDIVVYQRLVDRWYVESRRQFQAVHPRDLLQIIQAICEYEKIPLQVSPELMDQACEIYFVKHTA